MRINKIIKFQTMHCSWNNIYALGLALRIFRNPHNTTCRVLGSSREVLYSLYRDLAEQRTTTHYYTFKLKSSAIFYSPNFKLTLWNSQNCLSHKSNSHNQFVRSRLFYKATGVLYICALINGWGSFVAIAHLIRSIWEW